LFFQDNEFLKKPQVIQQWLDAMHGCSLRLNEEQLLLRTTLQKKFKSVQMIFNLWLRPSKINAQANKASSAWQPVFQQKKE
jgi:hypothetical protein